MSLEGKTVSHYEILSQLGGGGMGVVYRARDTKLDRPVALKFLPPELSRDVEANARFMQEAKAASALDHPNICTIYEVGESDEGQLFIAMALYDGDTLKYRLNDGPLEERGALDVARQIATGLATSHAKGIVHRDIKPANIMISDDGLVKILDFGLAKLPGVLNLTRTGSTLGTAAYMSPEQLRGQDVDEKTDLWALGIVLYQMLTGSRPFDGDYEQAIAYAITNSEPEFPEDMPSGIRELLSRLLSKNPAERYESATDVIAAIDGVSAGVSTFETLPTAVSASSDSHNLVSKRGAIVAGTILAIATIASLVTRFTGTATDDTLPEANTIAVMPFSVRGNPDLDYLGEGIVDLLSIKLDGIADFRSVDPNALFGVMANEGLEIVTSTDAVNLGRSLQAGRTVVGNVIQVGEGIQINASVYSSAEEPEVEASVQAVNDSEIGTALDELTTQIVAGLLSEPDWEAETFAMTTTSFPAMRAYLKGSQQMRDGLWVEASEAFRESVEIDSTFAMGWGSLAWAYGWLPDPREFEAWDKAYELRGPLPWRERTLIEAGYYGFNIGDGAKARDLYLSILAEYPNDTKALRDLGETLFHYNPLLGRPHNESNAYFEHAAAIAPFNVDHVFHVTESALDDWDFEAVDSLANIILDISKREDVEELMGNIEGVWRRTEGDSSWSFSGPGTMNTHFATTVLIKAATHIEDLEAAIEIADVLTSPDVWPDAARRGALFTRALSIAGRGQLSRFADAHSQAEPRRLAKRVVAQSILFGLPVYPVEDELLHDMQRELADWDTLAFPIRSSANPDLFEGEYAVAKTFLGALLARRLGDRETYDGLKRRLELWADPETGEDLAFATLRSLEALEYLQDGDFEAAVTATEEARLRVHWRDATASLLKEQFYNRFVMAEALRNLGRYEDAIRVYRSVTAGDHTAGLLLIGPSYLGVADAYDKLGNTEKAIEFYARLIHLWRNCDPALISIRDEAQAKLDNLLESTLREP